MDPGTTRTAGHKARNGALLFGAASLGTVLGLVLPHQAEVDEGRLVLVAAVSATLALIGVADRMRSVLRATDGAARIGGDEFVLLLPNSDMDIAAAVAERLTESAAAPDIGATPVGLCFGVAVCDAGLESLDDLMRRADQALYTKKRARYAGASSKTPLNAPMGRR